VAIVSGIVTAPLSVALYNADGSFRSPHYLITIGLPAFGATAAKTLYFGSPAYLGPDGQYWEEGIAEVGQINAGGAWLSSKWNPADLDIVLLDKKVTGQTVSQKLSNLFRTHEWVGATVLVQIAFDNTVSASDYRTIFKGRVEDWRDMDATGVLLYCAQDRNWSKAIPPNRVAKADFPYAPQNVHGTPRPILFGDWTQNASTIPTVSSGYETAQAGVARGAFPVLIVEQESASGGLTTPKVMLSDWDLHTDPVRLMYYEPALDVMAYSLTAPTITGTGPVYAQLASYQFYAFAAAIENETGGTTTALNWQELIRTDKPYTLDGCCTLHYDNSQRVLQLLMPDIQELGTFVGAQAYIWYNKNASAGTHPRFGVKNSTTVDGLQDFAAGATTPSSDTVPNGFTAINVGPTATGGTNSITGWADIKTTKLYADVRAATQIVQIFRFGLNILYKPFGRIVRPGVSRHGFGPGDSGARLGKEGRKTKNPFINFRSSTQDVTTFDTPLYAYGKGLMDSGHLSGAANGYYTGTSGALIDNPVELAHWALRELGGVSATEIENTTGIHGSFYDAAADIAGVKVTGQIAKDQPVEAFLEELGEQTLTWYFRKTTDPLAKFAAINWSTGADQNYRDLSDLIDFNAAGSFVERGSFKVGRTARSQVANVVRVNYDYDPRTRSFGDQVFVSPEDSRVYSFGAFTTDGSREASAITSDARYGRREITLNLTMVRDPFSATYVLTQMFDWRINPRVEVRFNTFMNALDLERGHIFRMGSDWNTFMPYPKAGSNGSWASKNFQVFSVTKLRSLPMRYAVVAIETL
jgi:hypothetical protein